MGKGGATKLTIVGGGQLQTIMFYLGLRARSLVMERFLGAGKGPVDAKESSPYKMAVPPVESKEFSPSKRWPCHPVLPGGESGIRTRDTLTRIHDFQSCSFNRSDISPGVCIVLHNY